MFALLIQVLVLCIVVGLVYWILTMLPLPEPFGNIARVVLVVIACFALISILLGLTDFGPGLRLRL